MKNQWTGWMMAKGDDLVVSTFTYTRTRKACVACHRVWIDAGFKPRRVVIALAERKGK